MKKANDTLVRLLKAAAQPAPPPRLMPFGFDTRVLALTRDGGRDDVFGPLLRRTALLALVIMALGTVGVYRSATTDDYASAYGMADTVIENQLSE